MFNTLSRRQILKSTSCGFGYLALAGLFANTARAATAEQHPLAAKKPHFTPRSKRVIFMFMQGGPSHVDTFDYKPALERDDGKAPTEVAGKGNRKLMKSPWKFSPAGQSGLMISELFPELAKHADDPASVKPEKLDAAVLCVRCHEANAAKPKTFGEPLLRSRVQRS